MNTAITNVNQSVNNEVLTVAFLTYAATNETNKYDNALVPSGKLKTTSFINPQIKTKP